MYAMSKRVSSTVSILAIVMKIPGDGHDDFLLVEDFWSEGGQHPEDILQQRGHLQEFQEDVKHIGQAHTASPHLTWP